MDLPDSPHLNFSVVLSPTTRCPSMSASLRSFSSRSGLFPGWTVSRSASFRALGFAIHSQARQDIKPNRVPHVRTDRLASGCSPPHLRGPRLLSPFGDAVTFGFQPVERLVERDLTSFSDALSGARVRRQGRPSHKYLACSVPKKQGRHFGTWDFGRKGWKFGTAPTSCRRERAGVK